jgi:hypothetical protein
MRFSLLGRVGNRLKLNALALLPPTAQAKKGVQILKDSEQKLLKTNVEKMSLSELPQNFMKTSQLKISSKYVDDNYEAYRD